VIVHVINVGDANVHTFAATTVAAIEFHGFGGNDRFNNLAPFSATAYGGDGNDILLGGSASDSLFGGAGDDYLDGRLSDDFLYGEDGDDKLFGDAGNDVLYGGIGADLLCGGDGNDVLHGDLGNDDLDGGAGTNQIFGGADADRFYNFKAKKKASATNDFSTAEFDSAQSTHQPNLGWFDANLDDPYVRTIARLQYRDLLFGRDDMLAVYEEVAHDGGVSSKELADLRTLCSKKAALVIPDDVRILAAKVANLNKANARYLGQALGDLKSGDNSEKLEKLVDKWFAGGDLPVAAAGTEYVWFSGELFQDGIHYTDVDQGSLGDCYFVGALAAIALKSPTAIENLFVDNGDGTFAVRFFNKKTPDYVTVNRSLPIYAGVNSSDYGKPYYAGVGGSFYDENNELWVALAEKAYVQLNEAGWIGQSGTNRYDGIAFGYAHLALRHITGTSSRKWDTKNTSESAVLAEFNAGNPITFSTKSSGIASHIVTSHIYVMTGYDSATRTFQLYNPWGPDNRVEFATTLSLTWKELVSNFGGAQSVSV
jgi:Ca2+-binding RTX toxin-like protein